MGAHLPGRVRLRIDFELMMRRAPPCGRVRHPAHWVLVACLFWGACGGEVTPDRASAGSPGSVQVVDATGTLVTLPAPARRIVSLVPSVTQMLHALGAGSTLVGRTDYDSEPWTQSIPSVGGGIEPNFEAVVALRPDLVIGFAGPQDPATPARLQELGIRHIAVRPDHIADIYRTAELLGAVIGRSSEADSLVAAMRHGLGSVADAVAGLTRVRVVYVLGGSPPWVSGPRTYIDEVLSVAGGDNVFDDLNALYSAVSPEQLRSRPVDVVLVSDDVTFDASLTPGARVVRVGEALEIPGPDVVAAARHVAELLHGNRLP